MRIVTWNIGLRGLRQICSPHQVNKKSKEDAHGVTRKLSYGSLGALLDSVNADIICLQEVKLSRSDLDHQLALAPGWESYFSCCKARSGYSGVATFCRLGFEAVEASDGLTKPLTAGGCALGPVELGLDPEHFSEITLQELDAEGRCVITDHGGFVLMNVYVPAACREEGDVERGGFKTKFLQLLQARFALLLESGRAVVVVGDLNIAPWPIDISGAEDEGGKGGQEEVSPNVRWMREVLREGGGPCTDVFRLFHPQRRHAYSCFNTATGAQLLNHGARIDHILVVGEPGDGARWDDLLQGADIMTDHPGGSDHLPVFMDLADSARKLGLSTCPDTPDGPTPTSIPPPLPSISSRFIFGSQHNIGKFFSAVADKASKSIPKTNAGLSPVVSPTDFAPGETSTVSFIKGSSSVVATQTPRAKPGAANKRRTLKPGASPKAQNNLLTFFVRKPPNASKEMHTESACERVNSLGSSEKADSKMAGQVESSPVDLVSTCPSSERSFELHCTTSVEPEVEDVETLPVVTVESKSSSKKSVSALEEWRRIQQSMAPPKCRGHREVCKVRVVKKAGPNQGRTFFCCPRPEGPKSNKEADCGFFQWANERALVSKTN